MKLHKNPSSGSQVASRTHTDRWTHGQNLMQVAADFTIKKILKMVNYLENVQSEAWGGRLIFTGQTHYRTYRDAVRQYLCTMTLHCGASDADNSHDPLKSQKHVLWSMIMLLRTCNFKYKMQCVHKTVISLLQINWSIRKMSNFHTRDLTFSQWCY